jgi:serine/threonine protein kinase
MPSIAIGTEVVGPNNEILTISDYLGRGAFGEVYRALGKRSGVVLAVKLLPLGELASDRHRTALLNEAKAAQKVRHPNVVEIFGVNDGSASDVGPYIVMEYVSGGTLARQIRAANQAGTSVPLDRAIEMMIEIAQGANAINQKVIHRDIKPDNIMLEGTTLKISDFGISKFIGEATRDYSFKGGQHVRYMAPEGWMNNFNTVKIDVYSVGLVYHEILTLQNPLIQLVKDPDNFLDWQSAHLYGQVPDIRTIRSDVPLSISQLLSRMVAKRPEDRPEWAEILKVLSQPATHPGSGNQMIGAAVQAALDRRSERERQALASRQREEERNLQINLYGYTCSRILGELSEIVAQFNEQYQHGQITIAQDRGTTRYRVPEGPAIEVTFFQPANHPIALRSGGSVIGGGWIGLPKGKSANLVLIKHRADDIYGQWSLCQTRFSAVALGNLPKIKSLRNLPEDTVEPFGFKDAYFYGEMQYLNGATHVFLYDLSMGVHQFFELLILEACKTK